jgi:FkbM family methyltransferase
LTLRDLEFDLPILVQTDCPTIIDVGANRGQTIDMLKSAFTTPNIYSFEPNPVLASRLMAKYGNCGVTIEASAAGSEEGVGSFPYWKMMN